MSNATSSEDNHEFRLEYLSDRTVMFFDLGDLSWRFLSIVFRLYGLELDAVASLS
jgi:hypothetical protein